MSTLERRVQLLLDRERYARVASEADRTGKSVNAVIRDAIDLHFPPSDEARSQALVRFLRMTSTPEPGPEAPPDYADLKRELDDAWDAEISRSLGE